jgi:methylmalonyl-CoA/ethylmalonyl-CoA epimerase
MSLIAPTEMKLPVMHHIGFVVSNIRSVIESFALATNCSWSNSIIHDPIQGVHVAFLSPCSGSGPLIELIEPAADRSPVTDFLRKGGGLHHVAYEVEDLEASLDAAHQRGSVIVRKPQPAQAFENRRIGWIYTRERLLIEYIER